MTIITRNSQTPKSFRVTAMAEPKSEPRSPSGDKGVKSPNIFERAKEEIEAIIHIPKHHKETHGTSDDINEDTPVDEVKGPGVFERVKEEFEALVEAIHPKKDDSHKPSS